MLRITIALTFFLYLSSPLTVLAAPLQSGERAELIKDLSEALDERYIFSDVAEEMVALINDKLSSGEYDKFETVPAFTGQLTMDLQSISHDLHLHVDAAQAPRRDTLGERLSQEEVDRQRLEQARFSNFGFMKIERLPGNIGYLDLRSFMPAEIGGETAIAAMNFLSNSSAIIIDLRNNGGGSPSMIQLISSYLFEERQHLNSFYIRQSDSTEQYWTQASVQGKKMVDTPVYILTSGRTFSAAEEFTYNLRNMERATVVGETTGGGAHPVNTVMSNMGGGNYASMTIPYGRAVNPITGTNWEGTGVEPHISTDASQALEVAQLDILEKLIEQTDDTQLKFGFEWAAEEIQSQQNPFQLNPADHESYAGQFGPRRIYIEGSRLYYQRGNGSPHILYPMQGKDRFRVGELTSFRIQFVRNDEGDIVELVGEYENGRTDGHQRSSS